MRVRRQSQDEVHLPAFYIARYPVIVAQFRFFVEQSGYDFERWDRNGVPNHPVVAVSWYDAIEYCRWLQGKLSATSHQRWAKEGMSQTEGAFWEGLASGRLGVSLPREAEWEKVARGADGRLYPWGDEFDPDSANTRETGLGSTSAAGCFPAGASPYGVLDLSGNDREWTRSLWGKDWEHPEFKYPYDSDDGREDIGAVESVH